MRRLSLIIVAALTSGCCYDTRQYSTGGAVGPVQSMTVHTRSILTAPAQPSVPPSVHVTRRYMGARPAWYEVGFYLPEPSVVRDCNGNLWIEEYAWGYPPPHVATPATTR